MFLLASCDDAKDPAYEPGNPSVGVYFPTDNVASVEVTKNTTSIPVVLERSGETEAKSYNLVVTTDAPQGVFTLPTSVSFGQNETKTTLEVPCNLSNEVAGTSYVLQFGIGADSPSFSYGTTSYSLTVSIPEAWSAWQPYDKGICTWFYDLGFLMDGPDPDLPIFYRQNLEVEGQAQFKIEHWRQDKPLTINYETATGYCYIPFGTPTGVTVNVSGAGALEEYVTDYYTYQMSIGKPDEQGIGASTFDEEKGLFNIFVVYYVINPENGQPSPLQGSYGYETCQVGAFKDYSVSLQYEGVFTSISEQTYAQLAANVGADCSEAKVMISNTMSAQQILEAIENGDENAVSVAPGENQKVQLPVTDAGQYTAVIVSYDGKESQNAASIQFTVILGSTGNEDWVNSGTGMIVDGWLTAAWQFKTQDGQPLTYEDMPWTFQMQKHKTQAGLYRMKSPWTVEECPLVQVGLNENTTETYNIVIDAHNPQLVVMEPQRSGFKQVNGFDNLLIAQDDYYCYIGNLAGMAIAQAGWSEQQIIDKGWNDTQLADGIITFQKPVFGSSEEFGYSWNSNPYSMVALNVEDLQSPAKKLNMMRDLKAKAKVMNMLKGKTKVDFNQKLIVKNIDMNKVVRVK